MRNPLRSHAGKTAIACTLFVLLTGCIVIPIPSEPPAASIGADARQSASVTLLRAIRVAPHRHLHLVHELSLAIRNADLRIEIVSTAEFLKIALPGEPISTNVSLVSLITGEAARRARSAEICLLVVSARTTSSRPGYREVPAWTPVYQSSTISFMIIILARMDARELYTASATGLHHLDVPLFYFASYPKTEEAVIKAEGVKIAETTISRCAGGPYRVVVMAERDSYLQPGSPDNRTALGAEEGKPDAQYALYEKTRRDDLSWSHTWLCKAADQGHVFALYRLGVINKNGLEGLHADPVQAYVWYQLAAKNASPDVAARLKPAVESLGASLAETGRLADAKSRLSRWRPGQCAEMVQELRTVQ